MPAKSIAQRRFMAMCEHGVSTNKACPDMSKKQFHDFAATKESKLPKRVKAVSMGNAGRASMKRSLRGSGTMNVGEIRQGHRKLETCPMGQGRMMVNPKK